MNIIFLDMDGVLNCSNVVKKWQKKCGTDETAFIQFKKKYCLNMEGPYLYFIVPTLLKRFNDMYSKIPDCKIVWSSSWRTTIKESKRFIEELFYRCGFPQNSFLSYTPDIRYAERKYEIMSWIKTFITSYKIEKCAIIDDLYGADLGTDEYLGIPIKFFQTSFETGLTRKIVNNILTFFNGDNYENKS